jgi:serine/threonine protein kinase
MEAAMSGAPGEGKLQRMRDLYHSAIRADQAAELAPGRAIGRCRIEKLLGRGGMGSVYLARHSTLDVPVAVKVLPPHLAAQEKGLAERFLREGKIAARLKHPNVVAVMDADRDPETGLYYLVMEYVEGESLPERLKRGPLDEKTALRIVRDVAKALGAAAAHGILHRDIKPANILLGRDGAKLADLGLARGREDTHLTSSDATLGTPHYMSPEQIEDARKVDARSDLYSLGATFYHLLTGEPPFGGSTFINIFYNVTHAPVPDPRERNPRVSAEAARICMKLMAKAPADRYPAAAALLEDLRRSGAPPTLRAKPLPPSHTAALVVGGVLLGLMLIFGIIVAASRAPGAPPPGRRAESKKSELRPPEPKTEATAIPDPPRPEPPPSRDPDPPRQEPLEPPPPVPSPPPPLPSPGRSAPEGRVLALGFEPSSIDGDRVRDASPRSNHGRIHGARPSKGRVGEGFYFDGRSCVEFPPIDERSVAMWVKPDMAQVSMENRQCGWFDGGASGRAKRAFQIGMFRPRGVFGDDARSPRSHGVFLGFWEIDAVVPAEEIVEGWHHVVVIWDGRRSVKIWLDGERKPGWVVAGGFERTENQPFELPRSPSPEREESTHLGCIRHPFWNTGSTHFRGTMDEVAVWERPLTDEEARSLFEFAGRGESYCGR